MATTFTATARATSRVSGAVFAPVRPILRLEGLAAAALSAVLYARTGASWWLFAALWLVPDLSMLGYLANASLGARFYNAIHSDVAPLAMAGAALVARQPAALPVALIWINHIGVDRTMGFGLKYPAGFGWTHLGRVRRGQSADAIARE